ncbi:ABC transporter substrate-binding protein [Sutcliffiella horikoshii]|nr:ABC transporter substrate-binding protein [Sutcliffiella horikoshii]
MKSRNMYIAIISLVLISLLVIGCGAQEELKESANGQAPKNEESSAETVDETKVVKHAMGETEIPVNPERIAVMFARDVESLLVLGVTPIGATHYVPGEFDTVAEYNQELKDAGVIDFGEQGTPNMEALLEAEPDLIILTDWHEMYEEASKIAPTIMLDTYGWDRFEELASILDKETEAEAFKKAYDKKIMVAKNILQKHVKEDETTLFISVYDKQIGVTDKGFIFNQLLYDKLGLTPPPDVIPEDEQAMITAEGLVDANPDIIFVSKHNDVFYDEIFSNPAVQQINAVKNNRVYELHPSFVRNLKGESLAIDFVTESITGEKE